MDERYSWARSRPAVLAVVLVLHLALLMLLLEAAPTAGGLASAPEDRPLTLMVLPPARLQPVHAARLRPERWASPIAAGLSPPLLTSAVQSGPGAAAEGHGPAVDWGAEAHRALRALEIRQNRPPNTALSVSSSWDDWWPGEHHAGDEFKTEGGDWLVWINADCYQVARWHENEPAFAAGPHPIICRATPRRRAGG